MTTRRSVASFALTAVLIALAPEGIAQDTTPSPSPSPAETERNDATKTIAYPSTDGKFAFLISRDDLRTIDLIDRKTEKALQRIDENDMGSIHYSVLWAPNSKGFALMTRAGHPNQDVRVYSLREGKFQEIKLPELTVEIPEKIEAGKEHPHVAANNWQEAEEWKKDGTLVVTIDNTIDGAGHTASATRTVLLGFDKSDKARILKSTVEYESRNDDE